MGEGLTIIFSIILVPALGFAIWLRTPQGERFLKSLDSQLDSIKALIVVKKTKIKVQNNKKE